jgi:small multidrug resistance family-3 protein
MKTALDRLVASSFGAFAVLTVAACLEVFGDACFQSGLYRSSGAARAGWFVAGVALLGFYGLFVNLPRWDFGRLLGVYVAMFFVVAPVLVGGGMIVAGGLLITFWRA